MKAEHCPDQSLRPQDAMKLRVDVSILVLFHRSSPEIFSTRSFAQAPTVGRKRLLAACGVLLAVLLDRPHW